MADAMQTLKQTGQLESEAQDEALVTYAHKLLKTESAINWSDSAVQISRQVRAFNPFPVASAQFRGETCRLWFAKSLDFTQENVAKVGEIVNIEDGLWVQCGQGLLSIVECQLPGAKRQTAAQFVHGQHVKIGEQFS